MFISIFAIILASLSLVVSLRSEIFTKKIRYDKNRPKVTLKSITLDPNKPPIFYKGDLKRSYGKAKKITDEERKILSSTLRKNTIIPYNGKTYMLINLCGQNKSNENIKPDYKETILAFDVLEIEMEFGNNRISELTITEGFSLSRVNNNKSYGTDIKLNVNIPINGGNSLIVPLAYATNDDSSLKLEGIYDLVTSGCKESIDFLRARKEAGMYIGFSRSAYLLRFETIDDDDYYYTLFLEVDNDGILVSSKLHNGRKLFDKEAKKARRLAGDDVVIYDEHYKKGLKGRLERYFNHRY